MWPQERDESKGVRGTLCPGEAVPKGPESGSAAAFNYTTLGELFEQESNDAGAYIDEMVKRLEADGHTVTHDVRVGPIARSILDALQDGDLVVMGSHGRSGLKRWVLGSIAEEVLRHSRVPVLMVKAPGAQS